jgi:hypothetical protein
LSRVLPNNRVIRRLQPQIDNMRGLMALADNPPRQRRGQL